MAKDDGEIPVGDFYEGFIASNATFKREMAEWKYHAQRMLEAISIPKRYFTKEPELSWEDRHGDLMRMYGQIKVIPKYYGRTWITDCGDGPKPGRSEADREAEAKYHGYSTWSDLRARQPNGDQVHRHAFYGDPKLDAGFFWAPYIPLQVTDAVLPVRTDAQRNAEAVYHGFADWADMQKSMGVGDDK